MKKLFALVMVLAMALAIAVPALASGWEAIPSTPTSTTEITLSLTALKTEPNTSVLGSLYEELSVMYPVIKGTLVHFYAEINIPGSAKLSDENEALLTAKKLDYKLSLSNLKLTEATISKTGAADVNIVAPASMAAVEAFSIGAEGIAANGYVVGIEYWAEGIAAGKDGVATATIGYYNKWTGATPTNVFGWDNDADGIDEFTVTHATGIYTITAAGTTNAIAFPVVEGTGKIDTTKEISLTVGGTTYYVNRAVNGDITFRNGTVVTTPADAGYAAIKATFDSFFTALGFGYAEANYMTEKHFAKYFGTIAEVGKTITYPSGTVVVAPPTVEPPQTGDATTVVGFVMIALALVAAAAVTVKKVRA